MELEGEVRGASAWFSRDSLMKHDNLQNSNLHVTITSMRKTIEDLKRGNSVSGNKSIKFKKFWKTNAWCGDDTWCVAYMLLSMMLLCCILFITWKRCCFYFYYNFFVSLSLPLSLSRSLTHSKNWFCNKFFFFVYRVAYVASLQSIEQENLT